MNALLEFFSAGPARLQALLIGALAVAVLCLGLSGWALWERSRVFEARAETEKVRGQLIAAIDQGRVLAEGLRACNAGVESTKKASEAALQFARDTLEQVSKLVSKHVAASARLEDLIRKGPPPGAGCHEAWAAIEAQRKAGAAR